MGRPAMSLTAKLKQLTDLENAQPLMAVDALRPGSAAWIVEGMDIEIAQSVVCDAQWVVLIAPTGHASRMIFAHGDQVEHLAKRLI
jgi:hypothetical protein